MSRVPFNPLDQRVCLEPPRSRAISRWSAHVPCVMYLVSVLEPDVVVDLAPGDEALYLGCCQAIDSMKLDAKAFAVRPRRQVAADVEDASARVCALGQPEYSRFSGVLEVTTSDALELFEPHSIDLLRIDGSRDALLVTRDFEAAKLPKIEPGTDWC